MKKVAIVIIASLLSIYSCSKDEGVGNVELNFKLLYDGTPLIAGQEYEYPQGYNFFITKYSMFLSELTLLNGGFTTELSQAEFIDIAASQFDAASAEQGVTLRFENIPGGDFDGLRISLGLPESLNSTAPIDYTSASPLSNAGEYWEGWSSYIFHKLEGRMDPDGDGELDTGIALHIGSDQAYRSKSISREISVSDGETTRVEIDIDLKDILAVDGQYFDLVETPQVHHLGVLPKVLPLMDNIIDAIK